MARIFSNSIVMQIICMATGFIFLGVAAIGTVTYFRLKENFLATALTETKRSVRSMATLYDMKVGGVTLRVEGGELKTIQRPSIGSLLDFDLVDRTAAANGGVATVFRADGADYTRISTNLENEKGERAVGTKLAADHPAQASLARGEAYFGEARLFGKDYMTGYMPVLAKNGKIVGILFVGVFMDVYHNQIIGLRNLMLLSGLIVMAVVGLLGYFAIRRALRPLGDLTGAVHSLASGDLQTTIPFTRNRNEFGNIARALEIFRENAHEKLAIENRSATERAQADLERNRNDAEKRAGDRQVEFAVSQLAAGLKRLSQGDLAHAIETPFEGRLEQVRVDFNHSLANLQDVLGQIRERARLIQNNGAEMLDSSEALSKRTESQAVSLEETAAAVDEITATVKASAQRAQDADQAVRRTQQSAENSGSVVKNAVDAMGRIESASREIEQIIAVIDEIAFQTNLLALNAGIEAARAGSAGRGFAVVAQEVRELAQRSGNAARQIKQLINQSTQEVGSGALLVQQAGQVLSDIGEQIVLVSQHVETIATATRDQSAALQEVNTSVNRMDEMTQQNADMAEKTRTSSHALAEEADTLLTLVQRFRIEPSDVGAAQEARYSRAA